MAINSQVVESHGCFRNGCGFMSLRYLGVGLDNCVVIIMKLETTHKNFSDLRCIKHDYAPNHFNGKLNVSFSGFKYK